MLYIFIVYGDRQIKNHHMSAVAEFLRQSIYKIKLPVVVPGTQKETLSYK